MMSTPPSTGPSRPVSELLGPQFEYESEPHQRCPQWEYYWYRKRQRVLKLVARHWGAGFDGSRPLKVADLGCNDSIDLFLIRNQLLSKIKNLYCIGVDANPRGLEISRLRKDYFQATNVCIVHADLTRSLPFRSHSLDLVYCSEVLEHLREPEFLIREVHRVLRPNGLLLITTPNEPNVLQRSFWSRGRSVGQTQKNLDQSTVWGNVTVYGHISLKRYGQWRGLIEPVGFREIDYERGGLVYSMGPRVEVTWGVQFLLESFLDLLPTRLVRWLSDEVIALYKRT